MTPDLSIAPECPTQHLTLFEHKVEGGIDKRGPVRLDAVQEFIYQPGTLQYIRKDVPHRLDEYGGLADVEVGGRGSCGLWCDVVSVVCSGHPEPKCPRKWRQHHQHPVHRAARQSHSQGQSVCLSESNQLPTTLTTFLSLSLSLCVCVCVCLSLSMWLKGAKANEPLATVSEVTDVLRRVDEQLASTQEGRIRAFSAMGGDPSRVGDTVPIQEALRYATHVVSRFHDRSVSRSTDQDTHIVKCFPFRRPYVCLSVCVQVPIGCAAVSVERCGAGGCGG